MKDGGIKARVIQINPLDLKLLDDNARYMTHEQYERLVENIRRDGCLSSVPFAWKHPDGEWEVLSGNHRVQAAIDAGLEEIDVMVTEKKLTKSQRLAIQLSHNEITGQDDPAMLARLYSEIEDVDMRAYSGFDDSVLQLLPEVDVKGIGELNLESRTLMFVFMPHELDDVQGTFDAAMAMAPHAHETYIGDRKEFERLLRAMDKIEELVGVRNRATALRLILAVFERHMNDLKDDGE